MSCSYICIYIKYKSSIFCSSSRPKNLVPGQHKTQTPSDQSGLHIKTDRCYTLFFDYSRLQCNHNSTVGGSLGRALCDPGRTPRNECFYLSTHTSLQILAQLVTCDAEINQQINFIFINPYGIGSHYDNITLGARVPVPRQRHRMDFCSPPGYHALSRAILKRESSRKLYLRKAVDCL